MATRAGEGTATIHAEIVTGEPESLEALAAAAKQRRSGAFDELARRIGPRLMAYAEPILRDHGLAEEAVQEALIRVYRFLPRYAERNFLAWSLTIANRVCMDLLRRERRHATLRSLVRRVEHTDPTHSSDSRITFEKALGDLPAPFAQVFLLHQQGLPYAQISEILEIAVGTVRSRLFRARETLREAMLDERM